MIENFKNRDDDGESSAMACWEIVECVNSIILRWDTRLKITFINDFGLRFFGYAPGEVLGRSLIGTIVPPKSEAGRDLNLMIEDILRRPEAYTNNENENVRRDGSRAWISWTNRAVRDQEGRVIGIISVGNDVTERKNAERELVKAREELEQRVRERTRDLEMAGEQLRREVEEHRRDEEALRKSENVFALAQQAAHVGVWSWDVRSGVLDWSDEVRRILGARPAEAGHTYGDFMDAIAPEDRERVDRSVRASLATGRHYSESFYIVRPDGERRFINCEGGVVFGSDGRAAQMLGVCFDVTDRRRAEEALRESEERFRATFDQAAVGISHVALDGRFIRVNRRYCEITGYPCEELTRRTYQEITCPQDQKSDKEVSAGLLEGRQPTYTTEKRYVRKDGSLVWVSMTVSLLRDAEGRPKYYIAVIQDISGRKRDEEALKKARARAELYLDLMSHDIGNMNQAMMGYLEMALDLADLREHRELIERPLEIIRHSSKLIASVKKLEQAQSGKYPAKLIDIGPLLREVIAGYAVVPGRDVQIRYAPAEGLYVRANDLLKDVFDHLVENAVRHSEGPLTVDVTVETVMQDGRAYYRVSVADNGPGIPDDLKTKVFRFVDADTGTPGRRGLGLFMVRALVGSYEGKAWAEDRVPGDWRQGTRFVVLLPVARQP